MRLISDEEESTEGNWSVDLGSVDVEACWSSLEASKSIQGWVVDISAQVDQSSEGDWGVDLSSVDSKIRCSSLEAWEGVDSWVIDDSSEVDEISGHFNLILINYIKLDILK